MGVSTWLHTLPHALNHTSISSNYFLHRKRQKSAKTQRYSEIRSFSNRNAKVLAQKTNKNAVFYATLLAHILDQKLHKICGCQQKHPVRQNPKLKRETTIFAYKSEQKKISFLQKDSSVLIHVDNLASNRNSSVLTVPRWQFASNRRFDGQTKLRQHIKMQR